MNEPLGEIEPATFLAEYWQKKPCLIRRAFPGFEAPLDGNDLAGLACEELAEARIVTGSLALGDWQLRHGPFAESEFENLGDRDWTLLVQDVEKHYPPLQELLGRFDFLPTWRIDDLMVSFAAPGGSVGPHTDQYDVFLLQVEGRRKWQIARQFKPELIPDCPLGVLAEFCAEQEWVLEAGDLLYLPPGVAHHGTAIDSCLTYSIGLRAPSAADLFLGLGEALAGQSMQGGRYTDQDLEVASRPGEIDRQSLARFQALLGKTMDDEAAMQLFIGEFLSRYRLAHEPSASPESYSGDRFVQELNGGAELIRHPWTRINWLERDGRARLFAAGSAFECSLELAQWLCASDPFRVEPDDLDPASMDTLKALYAAGHIALMQ